jgi:hypothetical protein
MNTKLTLSLDKDIINEAKKYAKFSHKSISKMIENYLKNIVSNNDDDDLTPIVNELAGSVKNINVNLKEDYTDFLIKKYK